MASGRRGGKVAEDLPKAKISKESLRDTLLLFRYIKPYRGKFTGGLIFIGLSALSTMLFPFLVGEMINLVSPAQSTSLQMNKQGMLTDIARSLSFKELSVDLLLGFLFMQLTIQMLFSYMRIYLLTEVGEKALADMRRDVFSSLLTMPMSFFSERRVGELTSRISADLSQIQDMVSFTLAEFLRGLLTMVVGVSWIVFLSPQLSLLMLSVIPVVAVVAVVFGMRIRKMSRQAQDQLADSGTIVQEAFQAIATVKAFTNEAFEVARYGKSIKGVVHTAIANARFRGLFVSLLIFSVFGAMALVLWYGAGLISEGKLLAGDLFSFVVFSAFVGGTFAGFADMFSQLQKTIGATQRVREILRDTGEPVYLGASNSHENTQRLSGNLIFSEVQFSYRSRPELRVMERVSFEVKKGEVLAVVGSSGAGKSTLASLLLQFYLPEAGEILFDGKPAKGYELTYLRSQMALVPQDVVLFGGTIFENIAYGKANATVIEIEAAAQKANAHEFITSFPQGYQTVVGERGIQLSGGQRQRIAIARAILKDPAILILDEATSSLDSESETLVQEALETLMKGRTSVVIAHRLSTIRNADRIIVLDKGKVAESGNHESLIKKPLGIYKKLFDLQYEVIPE